ncbi:MAG: hypothetical protein WKG07_41280 [Hymenobacter sp.]
MTMLFDYFGYLNLDTAYWSLTYEISFYLLITLLISYKLADQYSARYCRLAAAHAGLLPGAGGG